MPDVNLSHPSLEQLNAFAQGQLGQAEASAIQAHLAACAACRSAQAFLTPAPGDSSAKTVAPPGAAAPGPEKSSHDADTLPPGGLTAAGAQRGGIPAALLDHPRYRILQLLGTGGMGSVFKAEHKVMERIVALKVINRNLIEKPNAVERFHTEVKAAARLSHPNIVIAYDAEQAADLHFLVMEYVEGISLSQLVEKRGRLPIPHACEYVRQAALGLQHAFEKGMVHRDIKPPNLMLGPKGWLKILDFGLARFVRESGKGAGLTEFGVLMGTPDYMAPEQADDARQVDTRADIYSLGCTLYFLLTGQPPFATGTTLQKIMAHVDKTPPPLTNYRSDIPPDLLPVVDKILAKDPGKRYQTPIELARELVPFIKGTARAASPTATPSPVAKTSLPEIVMPRETPKVEAPKDESVAIELVPLAPVRVPKKSHPEIDLTPKTDSKLRRSHGLKRRRSTNVSKARLVASAALALVLLLVLAWIVARRVSGKGDGTELGRHAKRVTAVAFAPDGRRGLSASADGSIWCWDLDKRETITRQALEYDITCARFTTSRAILSSSSDGTLRLWELDSPEARRVIWTFSRPINCLALAAKTSTVVIGDSAGVVYYYDLKDRVETAPQRKEARGPITAVAISADGLISFAGSRDGSIRMYQTGVPNPWVFESEGHEVTDIALDATGTKLLSTTNLGKVFFLWNVSDQQIINAFAGHDDEVTCVTFSPDGARCLSGSRDKTLRLWDIASRREIKKFEGHTQAVTAVAFSPDGKRALSGSEDGTVRLWPLP